MKSKKPRKKNVLIHYERLGELLSIESYDQLKLHYKGLVEEYLNNGYNRHDEKWTKGVAVGSKSFVERVKSMLGVLDKGRKTIETEERYQLREPSVPYRSLFKIKNEDIGTDNTYY
ncbi:hypothetical protein M1N63_02145 [Thermodesulfovibrionales bacterium]|nr:hypothetical protein [Thermodesulfovibrionales bacterium]